MRIWFMTEIRIVPALGEHLNLYIYCVFDTVRRTSIGIRTS